ncbi:MAG TPA: hypothetical protein VL131_15320 [Gammaproteobacteria bacterium]|nr:hypothetical protein [Gammaproteobacteria bacterium]
MKAYFGIAAMLTAIGCTGGDSDDSTSADDFSAQMLEHAEKYAFPPTRN